MKYIKGGFRSSMLSVLAVGLMLSVVPFFSASAKEDKPKIRSIETVTASSVLLPITWEKYAKKENVNAKVKVRIVNLKTGVVTFQQFDTRVNGNGHTKVTVKGLQPSTDYAFKVKLRKITLKDFSDYSARKTAMTQ